MRIVSFFSSSLRRIGIAGAALLAVSPAALLAQGNTPSAADGFDPNVNGVVYATVVQTDGKIILGGSFTLIKPNGTVGTFHNNIARLNSDGSLDDSFDPNANAPVTAMVLQGDGKILIGGNFTTLQPNGASTTTKRNHLARLNSDGTVDPAFDPNASNSTYNVSPTRMSINAIAVQPSDGQILVGGDFDTFNPNGATKGTTRNYLARLSKVDGSPDSFDPSPNGVVLALAVQPDDNMILVGGGFTTFQPNGATTATTHAYVARLTTTGTLDDSFDPHPDAGVTALAVQHDGGILIGGYFATFQPNGTDTAVNHAFFVRVNKDGTLDTTFTNTNANGKVLVATLQPDGKILIGGSFTAITPGGVFSTSTHAFFARLNPDGSLDDAFNPGVNYIVDTMALQGDGKIVIGGNFTLLRPNGSFNATTRNRLARINADGSLDTNLDPNAFDHIQSMAVQADGKILLGGLTFTSVGGQTRNGVVRLNSDGTLDSAFNPNANGRVLALAVQLDQKIIVGGAFTSIGGTARNYIARLNADGSVDLTFDPNANDQVTALVIQSDGKTDSNLLVGGSFTYFTNSDLTATTRDYVARFNYSTDGKETLTLDTVFDPHADGAVAAFALQSDGKILIGGAFANFYPNGALVATSCNRLARLNTDGTIDSGFNAHANSNVTTLAVQKSDGKIVVGGYFTQVFANGATAAVTRQGIARFNTDGTLDAGFDPNTNNEVASVLVQDDGKIILGGQFTTLQPNGAADWTQRNYLARVNTDGTLDTSFNPNPNGAVRVLILQTGGKILLAGGFSAFQPPGGTPTTVSLPIARLNSDGSIDNTLLVSAGAPVNSQIKVNALAVQPDSRILAGGYFTALGGSTSSNLARFNTDNSADPSFNPAPDGPVNAVAVLSNNTGVVSPLQGFAWINQGGTLVPGFKPSAATRIQGQINVITMQSATQILLGGAFADETGTTSGNLVRFNSDGTLDGSFNPSPNGAVYAVVIRTDSGHVGQLLVAGAFTTICGQPRNHIALLNSDGSLDPATTPTFDPNANNLIDVMLQQSDGKILIGGAFTTLSPNGATTATTRNYMARLNTDGSIDAAFDPSPSSQVNALAFQADGQILVGGNFYTFQPNGATTTTKRVCIARLSPVDGTPDPAFDPNGAGNVTSLVVQPDTMILVGGNFTTVGGWPRNGIARLKSDGNLDASFDPNANGQVSQVALQPDGKILLVGAFTTLQPNNASTPTTRNYLARLNQDGTIDMGFDPSPDVQVNTVTVLSDNTIMFGGFFTALRSNGTMIVGGAFANIGGVSASKLARLKDDGTVDPTFQANPDGSTVNALLLQPDGKFLVGGDFGHIAGVTRRGIARFNVDGSLDVAFNATSFPPSLAGAVNALALQADGKILVGAPYAVFTGGVWSYNSLVRINSDGSNDSTFHPSLLGTVTALVVQSDGRILVADAAQASGLPAQPGRIVRLNADGSLDTSFNAYANGRVATLALQTDGRIVVGGVFTTVNGVARNRLARINTDGTLDTTFDPNANSDVGTLAIQTDGKVLVGGAFTLMSSQGRNLLARIAATAPAAGQALTKQTLTVSGDRKTITWTRVGSGPEISSAVFQQSTDGGTTWTLPVSASRVPSTSNWQLGGQSLPGGSLVYVRARGVVATNQNGSASIIESVGQFSLSTTTASSDYIGVAADVAGSTTSGQTTTNVAFGATLSASSVTDTGSGTQQSDAGTATGRLIALSARATVSDGYPLITGFIISGSGQKSVVLRAVGPGLSGMGVATPLLAAPRMQIYNGATPLLTVNTGWDASGNASSLIALFNRLGEFSLAPGSADAATLVTLSPGAYTVVIPDGQGSGTVLAEVYDADASTSTGAVRFTGLSARGQVTAGDPVIAGLSISGTTPRRVLLRGSGPALAKSKVSGVLSDPLLSVYDSQDQLLAQNDNWQIQTSVNATQTIGSTADVVAACLSAFDSGSKDSALIITLAPGTYTIMITGVSQSTGAAMVEAYDLTP